MRSDAILVEVLDFWNDDDTDDDNWVVLVFNKTTLFENNDHWMGGAPISTSFEVQHHFLSTAANTNGTDGMFQIEILITTKNERFLLWRFAP